MGRMNSWYAKLTGRSSARKRKPLTVKARRLVVEHLEPRQMLSLDATTDHGPHRLPSCSRPASPLPIAPPTLRPTLQPCP
jgi:hypothetical protein